MEKEVETDYQMIRGPRPYEDGADTMTIIKAIKEQRQKERAEKRARQTASGSGGGSGSGPDNTVNNSF
ncbi:hypothetical protein BV898_06763 [Hypsibius exemplaris]|uniref:Uncharacterized protein n=1 Tax=Hypsibius exemplaris TaxID=2072580 RepID=A0A1W0WVA4_HYPEX|nr:hypothetical protein BV898_06763 [Hypsibius exemplaris]